MNPDSASIGGDGNVSDAKPRTVTNAVLGMAKSHGMKLSLNMTSQDKEKLLTKLEEWRKARKEKLAASILAKQKQVEKPKVPIPVLRKSKSSEQIGQNGELKSQDKESVFDRLYKNSRKAKQQEDRIVPSGLGAVRKLPLQKPKILTTSKSVNSFGKSQDDKGNTECFTESNASSVENGVGSQGMSKVKVETTVDVTEKKSPVMQINEELNEQFQEKSGGCNGLSFRTNEGQNAHEVLPFLTDEQKSASDSENHDKNIGILSALEKAGTFDYNCKDTADTENVEKLSSKIDSRLTREHEILKQKDLAAHFPVHKGSETKRIGKSNVTIIKPMPPKGPACNKAQKTNNSLRRSLSMVYRQKCRAGSVLHRTLSEKNLNELRSNVRESNFRNLQASTVRKNEGPKERNENTLKSVSFVTPKSNKSLTSSSLRNKLEDWLKTNGHSLEGYRHLRCFGVDSRTRPPLKHSAAGVDNTPEAPRDNDAQLTQIDYSDKENVTPPTVKQQIQADDVENWLKELHRLIVELKYPSERCEEWLDAIRKKCPNCSKLPIYWDCFAALQTVKWDLKSLEEAGLMGINKGSEVDAVGDSLSQLFDKLVIEHRKPSEVKLEKGLDPKNIFKSTIIKFALQPKPVKELDSTVEAGSPQQLLIATPVRRSSRIQTPFKSDTVTSLQSLSPDVRRIMKFKPNESLLSGE